MSSLRGGCHLGAGLPRVMSDRPENRDITLSSFRGRAQRGTRNPFRGIPKGDSSVEMDPGLRVQVPLHAGPGPLIQPSPPQRVAGERALPGRRSRCRVPGFGSLFRSVRFAHDRTRRRVTRARRARYRPLSPNGFIVGGEDFCKSQVPRNSPLLRLAFRAVGCADVRSGVLRLRSPSPESRIPVPSPESRVPSLRPASCTAPGAAARLPRRGGVSCRLRIRCSCRGRIRRASRPRRR